MNKDLRITKINELLERDLNNEQLKKDLLRDEIMWDGDLKSFYVHKIPLSFLVYNKYNGRILSRTKSLEKQNRLINLEEDEGRLLIEKLLWESKIDRNKTTLDDLKKFGQKKIGIITKDGVIIDGNRRAMLLNKIDRTGTFKAIVLPVTLEENPIEIERLETTYQMGEDEKLGYNPIEKYLKAKQIYEKLTPKVSEEDALNSIADWMGEQKSEVKKYLNTMQVMDEYLYYFGYDGIYTQLDKREDQFLFLTRWLDSFYDKESKKGFDGYNNDDVDELKEIAFDYLRIRNKYDGKEFRNLADGQRENHFFGDKKIWTSFSNRHEQIRREIPEEPEIDFNSNDLKSHLDDRDNKYFDASKFDGKNSAFLENLKDHKQNIYYNREAEAPEKLVKKASQAFSAIKQNHRAYSKTEVQNLVKDLAIQVTTSMSNKSPLRLLQHIESLVKSIELDNVPESELDEVQKTAKEINKLLYPIYK
jgi:hypothetical protein